MQEMPHTISNYLTISGGFKKNTIQMMISLMDDLFRVQNACKVQPASDCDVVDIVTVDLRPCINIYGGETRRSRGR